MLSKSLILTQTVLFLSNFLSILGDNGQGNFSPIRINCGSTHDETVNGVVWEADRNFPPTSQVLSFGANTADHISNTDKEIIFQSERFFLSEQGGIIYSFSIPNGLYSVKLLFAEIYFIQPGKRIFDVKVQNNLVLSNLDIYHTVGHDTAFEFEYDDINVNNGILSIELIRNIENPQICGIIINDMSPPDDVPPPPDTIDPIRITCGVSYEFFTYTDYYGNIWKSDFGLHNNGLPINTMDHIENTLDDKIYQTQRIQFGEEDLVYTFNNLANTKYDITLHFSETYFTTIGSRVMDISIQGHVVYYNLDIYYQVGHDTALTLTFKKIKVTTGTLEIRLVKVIENPKISGIEIIQNLAPPVEWIIGTPFPYEIGEVSACAVDNKGYYLFGGNPSEASGLGFWYEGINYYDIATATWSDIDPKIPFFAQADHQTPQPYNGKIYSFGGGNFVIGNFMRVFDPLIGQWQQLAELLVDGIQWLCQSPSSAIIGDKIYIAGGIINGKTVDRMFEYDITNNIWTEKARMPDGGRNHAAGIGYNGLFYLFGGRKGGNFPNFGFTDTFIYDPSVDGWFGPDFGIAPMLEGTGGAGQAVLMNGKLIVIGGEDCCHAVGKVQAYDPLMNTWEFLPDMITPRHGIAPVAIDNKIYVAAGGLIAGFSQSTTHEIMVFD